MTKEKCTSCNGTGEIASVCAECFGEGEKIFEYSDFSGMRIHSCSSCNGTGIHATFDCPNCNGEGYIQENEYPHISTIADYEQYKLAVGKFFDETGLVNLSFITDEDGDHLDPHFSWSSCDVCGRALGGDRYECNGWSKKDQEVHDEINACQDCIYFAEYGRLDDQTMLDIGLDI